MTAPVFVDTNVLVYSRDASEPADHPFAVRGAHTEPFRRLEQASSR
jgi:hypothetical protein